MKRFSAAYVPVVRSDACGNADKPSVNATPKELYKAISERGSEDQTGLEGLQPGSVERNRGLPIPVSRRSIPVAAAFPSLFAN